MSRLPGCLALLGCAAVVSLACRTDERVLGLPKVETVYTDPEKAPNDGKPVRIEREARYIEQWEVWLLMEHHLYYEGGDIAASLRTQDGQVRVAYPPMAGPLIISEPERRILDCGISAHYEIDAAVLFDLTGRALRKIPRLTHTRNCGRTDDAKLFWLHYNAIENGAPINVLRVIDRDGNTVHEARSIQAGSVSFTHDSHPYNLDLPAPEYPD